MATISSKIFTVAEHIPEDTEYRAARRFLVNPECLKPFKMSAGEVVAILNLQNSETASFSVGVLWPDSELEKDVVSVTRSHVMTAGLTLGGDVRIYPLSGNVPSSLPALRQVQGAGAVRVAVRSRGKHAKGPKISDGKPRDWLTLLVKEELVDLKYVTSEQKFSLPYEGNTMFFEVDAISPQSDDTNASQDSISQLEGLRIDDTPRVWIVGWDTAVVILPADVLEPLGSTNRNQLTDPDPYAAVGGLDKQISQIRDLVDFPLARPDLFRHLGSHCLILALCASRPLPFLPRSQTTAGGLTPWSTWYRQDPSCPRNSVLHKFIHHCCQRTRAILGLPWGNRVEAKGGVC